MGCEKGGEDESRLLGRVTRRMASALPEMGRLWRSSLWGWGSSVWTLGTVRCPLDTQVEMPTRKPGVRVWSSGWRYESVWSYKSVSIQELEGTQRHDPG